MIKRTLVFTNPAYLSTKNEQLIIKYPVENKKSSSVPIEDIGFILLENQQITITNSALSKLAQSKAVVIGCDNRHLPCAMFMPTVGHTQQTQRFRFQINSSLPLKKQLWRQTIIAKITNQARQIENIGKDNTYLYDLTNNVTSGDSRNCEAVAASFYFKNLFDRFVRDRDGAPPNNLLNYGYAILRAITARALVSTGLLVSVGIQHHNKYNPYCLADDIMEPYRPFVDSIVYSLFQSGNPSSKLTKTAKGRLLSIPKMDVLINDNKSPLMIAMSITTNSLFECFKNQRKKIIYPVFP